MVTYWNEHEYRKASKKGGLVKLWLRFGMYLLHPLILALKVLFAPSGSVFVVTSSTFYAPAIAAVCARIKGQRIVNLVYDLYPDALEVGGKLKLGSVFSRLLGLVTRHIAKTCDYSIYLGEFLRQHAETRWGKYGLTESIDISADASLFQPNRQFEGGSIRIHYGGQLGYMHDADSVIELVSSVAKDEAMHKKFEFSFRVSGARAKWIEAAFATLPVQVFPPLPSHEWREEIQNYNIGLVSLSPGGATVCLPSKSYAMMAGGLPIIAICPLWSDLAQVLLSADAGWVVSNSPYNSADELAEGEYLTRCRQKLPIYDVKRRFEALLKHIAETPAELVKKRANALNAMDTIYGKVAIGKRWQSVLAQVT